MATRMIEIVPIQLAAMEPDLRRRGVRHQHKADSEHLHTSECGLNIASSFRQDLLRFGEEIVMTSRHGSVIVAVGGFMEYVAIGAVFALPVLQQPMAADRVGRAPASRWR